MLTLSIKHPDAENFIDAKVETGKVTGANVSIKIDDEFMQVVKENKSITNSSLLTQLNHCMKKRSMPVHCGIRLFIMPGNRLNPEYCSGIQ